MIPLTPEEKLQKKQKDQLHALCNRIMSAFNFKTIKTWHDVYKMEGLDDNSIAATYPLKRSMPILLPELKTHLDSLKSNLEHKIKQRSEAPVMEVPVVTELPPDESGLDNDSDYGLHMSEKEMAYHFWFQKKAIKECWDDIVHKKFHGVCVLSSTGTGKTFIAGGLCRRLVDADFAKDRTYGATKYLYVTRATIVEQTKRVFEKFYNLTIKDGVEILNIEQLRSRAGTVWIKEKIIIQGGKELTVYEWRRMMNPVVVLWDECQALKNEGSTQHQIAAALNDLPDVVQVFISATPFTRVIEAKCFAVSTRKNLSVVCGKPSIFQEGACLSNATWPTYASIVAAPSGPEEYNEAAVERLTKDLDKYIVRVRGVRPQFDAHNKITMIHFETQEERKYYEDTEARYLRKKRKMEQDIEAGATVSGIWALVLLNERCMAAELCRKEHLAKRLHQAVQDGYAGVCALKYKATMIAVVQILASKYGVPRDKISLVWGGGQTALTKKQKTKAGIKEKAEQLEKLGIGTDQLLSDLDLEDVEDRVIEELEPSLRLGPQSKEERQREIDRFQSGKTLYALYTFKAGGVGLSLHHSDEMSAFKCRRKKNGYVVLEDIPKVPIRPRKNFVAPTYSAMELVQGLGRCPRLTSLSDTEQELLFYTGTVEDDVARIVSQKLRCLSRVVRMRESWQDVVVGNRAAVEEHVNNTKGVVDDPDELAGTDEEEEE